MSQPEDNTPLKPSRSDYDGAWKAALEKYFNEFLALLFPAIHNEVDWSKGYEFLDGELEKITVDAKTGRRYTDKLVKVYYQDGTDPMCQPSCRLNISEDNHGPLFTRA